MIYVRSAPQRPHVLIGEFWEEDWTRDTVADLLLGGGDSQGSPSSSAPFLSVSWSL